MKILNCKNEDFLGLIFFKKFIIFSDFKFLQTPMSSDCSASK